MKLLSTFRCVRGNLSLPANLILGLRELPTCTCPSWRAEARDRAEAVTPPLGPADRPARALGGDRATPRETLSAAGEQ